MQNTEAPFNNKIQVVNSGYGFGNFNPAWPSQRIYDLAAIGPRIFHLELLQMCKFCSRPLLKGICPATLTLSSRSIEYCEFDKSFLNQEMNASTA